MFRTVQEYSFLVCLGQTSWSVHHCPGVLLPCLSGADVLECSSLSKSTASLSVWGQTFWSVHDCPRVQLPCLSGADVLECSSLSKSTASLSVWGRRSGVFITVQEYCFIVCLGQTFWSVQDCPGVQLPCLSGADVLECSSLSRSTASLSVWGQTFWSVHDCPRVQLPCLSGADVLECS